jgi:hypothetical protein
MSLYRVANDMTHVAQGYAHRAGLLACRCRLPETPPDARAHADATWSVKALLAAVCKRSA